jgi:hypothetical protein
MVEKVRPRRLPPRVPSRLTSQTLWTRALPGMIAAGALLELCWTVWLGLHLPVQYVTSNWDVAWVGIDVAEVVALLLTAWTAWHEKVELSLCSGLAATLIVTDAWFDVATNHSGGVNSSVLSLAVELPAAALLYWVCLRTFKSLKAAQRSVAASRPPEAPTLP